MLAVEVHSHPSRSADGHGPVIQAGEIESRQSPFRIALRQACESATRRRKQQFF